MNYNYILEKVNANNRNKVKDIYDKINSDYKSSKDFMAPMKKVTDFIHNAETKAHKIDDTIKEKAKQYQTQLQSAIDEGNFDAAQKISDRINSLPNLNEIMSRTNNALSVAQNDIAYQALDRFLNNQITNRLNKLLGTDRVQDIPGAILDRRAQVISIIKTYKHIKDSDPALAKDIITDITNNIEKDVNDRIVEYRTQYFDNYVKDTSIEIDNLYNRVHDQLLPEFQHKYEDITSKAVDYEGKINNVISKLSSINIAGINKAVDTNIKVSKLNYVTKHVDQWNKQMARYTELANKALDRARSWAQSQVQRLADAVISRVSDFAKGVVKSVVSKIKF